MRDAASRFKRGSTTKYAREAVGHDECLRNQLPVTLMHRVQSSAILQTLIYVSERPPKIPCQSAQGGVGRV